MMMMMMHMHKQHTHHLTYPNHVFYPTNRCQIAPHYTKPYQTTPQNTTGFLAYFGDEHVQSTAVSIPTTVMPGIVLILVNCIILTGMSVLRRQVPRAYGWVSWCMYTVYLVLAIVFAVVFN